MKALEKELKERREIYMRIAKL
jgi:hypothetical protein